MPGLPESFFYLPLPVKRKLKFLRSEQCVAEIKHQQNCYREAN